MECLLPVLVGLQVQLCRSGVVQKAIVINRLLSFFLKGGERALMGQGGFGFIDLPFRLHDEPVDFVRLPAVPFPLILPTITGLAAEPSCSSPDASDAGTRTHYKMGRAGCTGQVFLAQGAGHV
jgi:hypothetical protein